MQKKSFIYRVKPNAESWFIGNTFAILIDDYRPEMDCGLFLGTVQCLNPSSMSQPYGSIYEDEEICGFEEFDDEPFGTIEFEYRGYVGVQ